MMVNIGPSIKIKARNNSCSDFRRLQRGHMKRSNSLSSRIISQCFGRASDWLFRKMRINIQKSPYELQRMHDESMSKDMLYFSRKFLHSIDLIERYSERNNFLSQKNFVNLFKIMAGDRLYKPGGFLISLKNADKNEDGTAHHAAGFYVSAIDGKMQYSWCDSNLFCDDGKIEDLDALLNYVGKKYIEQNFKNMRFIFFRKNLFHDEIFQREREKIKCS